MRHQWYYVMDAEGETPMSRAVKSGHLALTTFMLRQRHEDAPENSGSGSLLQRAAYWGLEHAVQRLLEGGADPSERDQRGETPLHKAARRGHLSAVEALLESGADVNVATSSGMTTLHWAALNGREDLAELLLENGAAVNARERLSGGLTPLAMAKLMGYEELAEYLGSRGGTW